MSSFFRIKVPASHDSAETIGEVLLVFMEGCFHSQPEVDAERGVRTVFEGLLNMSKWQRFNVSYYCLHTICLMHGNMSKTTQSVHNVLCMRLLSKLVTSDAWNTVYCRLHCRIGAEFDYCQSAR